MSSRFRSIAIGGVRPAGDRTELREVAGAEERKKGARGGGGGGLGAVAPRKFTPPGSRKRRFLGREKMCPPPPPSLSSFTLKICSGEIAPIFCADFVPSTLETFP